MLELLCQHMNITVASTQLNSLKFFNLTQIIEFDINPLFADSEGITIAHS